MPAPTLTDGVVTLRAPRPDDAQGSWEQCQDPDSQRFTMAPVPYSHADAHEFVTEILPGGWERGEDLGFVLEVEGRYAGSVSLRPRAAGLAEIGYGSHPWVRGTGHVETGLRLLLEWGFAEQGFTAVVWEAHVGNWASRKLAHRLGFRVEGSVRRLVPQRGELRDAWIGSLLRDDPREPPHRWLEAPVLEADGVRLRPLRDGDAVRIVEACRDEQTLHWLGELPRDYTIVNAAVFLESVVERLATGTGVTFAVADPSTDQMTGVVGLWDVRAGRQCELGYWTHPDARGRGLTARAARLALGWATAPADGPDQGLGLDRVYALAAAGNTTSQRVLDAVGMTRTGVHRRAARLGDGSADDLVCYDLLADPAPAPHPG